MYVSICLDNFQFDTFLTYKWFILRKLIICMTNYTIQLIKCIICCVDTIYLWIISSNSIIVIDHSSHSFFLATSLDCFKIFNDVLILYTFTYVLIWSAIFIHTYKCKYALICIYMSLFTSLYNTNMCNCENDTNYQFYFKSWWFYLHWLWGSCTNC